MLKEKLKSIMNANTAQKLSGQMTHFMIVVLEEEYAKNAIINLQENHD